MIHYTIPLPPITKKNSQQIVVNKTTGRPFLIPSKQFKEYERTAGWYLKPPLYISEAVNVKCLFYMPTVRLCDLTNLLEAADDVLVKYGVVTDDNYSIIAGHDGSRVYIDRKNPRTEIFIEKIIDNPKKP